MDMDSLFFFDIGNKYPYLLRRSRKSFESLPEIIKEKLSSKSLNKLDSFLHPKNRVPSLSDFHTSSRRKEKKQLGTIEEINAATGGKNKKFQKLLEQAGFDDKTPDNNIEDDARFLFEEAKFSATNVILQLGKLLDIVVAICKDNPQKAPVVEPKDSSIVLRQGSADIVWRFESPSVNPSLSRHHSGLGFHPSEAIIDLLSISYVDLIKNTQYRQREWQTHTYKHAVDSTVKGTDSGIFSVPQTAMSGVYVKGDDSLKPTVPTKTKRKSEDFNVLNVDLSKQNACKDAGDLARSKGKTVKLRTRIERFSLGRDGTAF